MLIEMIEKTYPHVEALKEKPNKTPEDRKRLSQYGTRGNESAKRRRRIPAKNLPLFPKLNLDPKWEFPLHEVLYRGQHFLLLEAKRKTSEVARRRAAMLDWVRHPSNYTDECRLRDEQANLHVCPID
jgi:hypothetical protein